MIIIIIGLSNGNPKYSCYLLLRNDVKPVI